MQTPEKKLKEEVKKYLRSIGAYFFMPVQMGFGATTLDFLVSYRGRFIGIETKAVGKKATPRQEAVIRAIKASNGIAFVAWSIKDVKDTLQGRSER